MKIILVDNFDRDTISDTLIAENVGKKMGEIIVKFLNDRFSGSTSPDYFRLVSDDHKLYSFEP